MISLMNGSRQGNRRVKSSIVSPVYISIQNLFKIFFQTLNFTKISQIFSSFLKFSEFFQKSKVFEIRDDDKGTKQNHTRLNRESF